MSIEETIELVRMRLRALADPATQTGVQRYFKETIRAYGVSAPKIQKLGQEIYRVVKPWPEAQRNRFCTGLFRSGVHEEGTLAIYVYRYFKRSCDYCEFRLFESWIDRFVNNWAWCDGISCWLIYASLANKPALLGELPEWTESKNRWKRRAAAVSLVPFVRRGEQHAVSLDVASRLWSDSDDMVQKGVGWLLKDAYPKKPKETTAFLRSMPAPPSRLVLRIAAEKMTASDRARALGRDQRRSRTAKIAR